MVSRNLANVEFLQIPRQYEFHVFRGTESGAGHLAHFEWLKMRHVSSGELVKHELKCGVIGDKWHLVSGWKTMIDG